MIFLSKFKNMNKISSKYYQFDIENHNDCGDLITIKSIYEHKQKEYTVTPDILSLLMFTHGSKNVMELMNYNNFTTKEWFGGNEKSIDRFHTVEFNDQIVKINVWQKIIEYKDYIPESFYFDKFGQFAIDLIRKHSKILNSYNIDITNYNGLTEIQRSCIEILGITYLYPLIYVLSGGRKKYYICENNKKSCVYFDVNYTHNLVINIQCVYKYYNTQNDAINDYKFHINDCKKKYKCDINVFFCLL